MKKSRVCESVKRKAYEFYKSNNLSQAEVVEKFNISRSTFERYLKKQKLSEELDEFIPEGQKLKGSSALYKDGVKVLEWVKTDHDKERQLELVKEAVEAITSEIEPIEEIPAPKANNSDLMTFLPMGDPHIGLYCWEEEVGEKFDLEIAKRDLMQATMQLVDGVSNSSRCIIANLGDFFHADNMEGKTARSGHVLDMASRAPHMMRTGFEIMRFCIDYAAKKFETVEVINAVGNHDDLLSMALSSMLANVYEKNHRIIIHDQPTTRHYVRHDKVLIGVTHGNNTKDQDLPLVMATEKAKEWGETMFRYFFRGHHHHDSRKEYNGCIVEQCRTLAARDAHATAGGWLAGRDMKAIVFHKKYGEVARNVCSIDMLRDSQNGNRDKKLPYPIS